MHVQIGEGDILKGQNGAQRERLAPLCSCPAAECQRAPAEGSFGTAVTRNRLETQTDTFAKYSSHRDALMHSMLNTHFIHTHGYFFLAPAHVLLHMHSEESVSATNVTFREKKISITGKNNVISTNVKPLGCFAVADPIAAVPTNCTISFENAVVVDHATHNTPDKIRRDSVMHLVCR